MICSGNELKRWRWRNGSSLAAVVAHQMRCANFELIYAAWKHVLRVAVRHWGRCGANCPAFGAAAISREDSAPSFVGIGELVMWLNRFFAEFVFDSMRRNRTK